MVSKEEIKSFIRLFNYDCPNSKNSMFRNGLCYWFSYILKERFRDWAVIFYSPIDNHFITKIGDDYYDITGEVTNEYPDAIDWNDFDDSLERSRIVRDCILKERGM